jgi:RNA polymerase sigma-70 factor (ECF subfamily)
MEDKLLIWKCKRGNRDALRRIYEKYHADLLKLALMLTGQAHAADDIVHDVFVQFVRAVPRLSLTGSLKGYLIASTVNRVRTLRRNRSRRNECNLDQAIAQRAANTGPEQWAILSEQLERLSDAVAQLPYEQREVITLRMQAGLTFRQIALSQKTSLSTVQGRYRYGIDKLRSLVNGERSK